MYTEKLDDIAHKYNNTYHSTIKMNPVDVKSSTYIDFKIDDHLRISKYKNIFVKGYTPNWSEQDFVIEKLENTVPWTYFISNLNGGETVGALSKMNCKKQIRKSLELKKKSPEKVINYMLNGRATIFYLIVGFIKKISLYKMSHFPEPFTRSRNKVKVDLDFILLCNKICLIKTQKLSIHQDILKKLI